MKTLKIILPILVLLFFSCNGKTTLQEYYVENQKNNQFVALDLPASLLTGENSGLSQEQKATLETVEKVNIIAFPLNEENEASYGKEKSKVSEIIENDDYQTLMKYKFGDTNAELYYLGEVDAIDELIVFAANEDRGFGVVRILGEDMKPEDLMQLIKSARAGDLNLDALKGLEGIFIEKKDSLVK